MACVPPPFSPLRLVSAPETPRRAVLVVDDEPMILALVVHVLTANGHPVLSAANGLEAWSVFPQHAEAIGTVLTDLSMPLLDGRELLSRMLAEPRTPTLVACSGERSQLRLVAYQFGPSVRLLAKPFHSAGLLKSVQVRVPRVDPT